MNYSGRKSTVIRDYILLGIGTLLIALAVKEYLIPCQIVTGSVSGLALLFNEVFGILPNLRHIIKECYALDCVKTIDTVRQHVCQRRRLNRHFVCFLTCYIGLAVHITQLI